ncbi:UNVERIFIED_CONTAM: uncharacterized protein YjdB [Brevibacillus sp. OAP136]
MFKRTPKRMAAGALIVCMLLSGLPVHASDSLQKRETESAKIQSVNRSMFATEASHRKLSSLPASAHLVIIKCSGPIQEEWKESLEQAGATLGDYLPEYSYLAKVKDSSDLDKLTELTFVESVRPFHPAYKLSPELLQALDQNGKVEVTAVGFDRKKDLTRSVKRFSPTQATKGFAQLSVKGTDLEDLLLSDDIVAVLPKEHWVFSNDRAAGIIQSNTLASTGYTGKNQIIGIADSGLDRGSTTNIHPDFVGQVKKLIPVGRANNASDPDGHGTHVAGSVVGTGKASNGKVKGMAPDAKLVFHSMSDSEGELTGDFNQFLTEAYNAGARIHSDSWGTDDRGVYGYSSAIVDQFIWDHKDMSVLVAGGNSGRNGKRTIGSPATAKNVISVGASENNRPDLVSYGITDADNPNEIAEFSSRGPTADGRIKPDVVAPGTWILSTRSALAPDDSFWSPMNQYYAYMGGTSMATPILAGGVAQVRQFLNEQGVSSPSSALIKSMIVNGSDDLGLDLIVQGFGRANLAAAIGSDYKDETSGLKTGQSTSYTITVNNPSKPFSTTLVWTDYPSYPNAGKTLVNDLDLTLTSPSGKTYAANGGDHLNNVENLYFSAPEKGTYTVKVTGYNVPKGSQPYAITTNGKLSSSDSEVRATGISLDKSTLELTKGGSTGKLTATVKPSSATNKTVTWSSSKTSVATVNATGTVTPVGEGQATITATTVDGGFTASAKVKVSAGSTNDNQIAWGEVQTAKYSPLLDTILAFQDELSQGGFNLTSKQVTTKRDDADFVINQYGAIGARAILELPNQDLQEPTVKNLTGFDTSLRGVADGKMYLMKIRDNVYAKVRVDRISSSLATLSYVLEKDGGSGGDPDQLVSLEPSQSTLFLAPDQTATLTIQAVYADGSKEDIGDKATWSVEDDTIASVENGEVTATSLGTTTITVEYEGLSVDIPVKVTDMIVSKLKPSKTSATLPNGKSTKIIVKAVYTNNTTEDITDLADWVSSNTKVAEVSKGVVKAISKGKTTITVTYGGKTINIKVTVK